MESQIQYNSELSFEKVWAMFQETDRQFKETDRKFKETDRQFKETREQMKETDKRVGALTNRFGEVVEHMIVPNLKAKFNELGFTFEKVSRDVEISDRKNNIFTELDVFMENGDCAMVVEMKTKLRTDDIDEHIKRMEKVRLHAELHSEGRSADRRSYYGAIAAVVISESEKTYALKKGFYVIEPSGESFTITCPEGAYAPRAW